MKIWAFVAEIFAKQYWCFLIIDFQCIFDISAIMHLRSLQRWIITEWLWNFFETRSQNGPISVKWKHQSQLIFCILRLSYKHIDFDSSQGTPCRYTNMGLPELFHFCQAQPKPKPNPQLGAEIALISQLSWTTHPPPTQDSSFQVLQSFS